LVLLTRNVLSEIHWVFVPVIVADESLKNEHCVLVRSPELLKLARVLWRRPLERYVVFVFVPAAATG
jgi:hypothetical protein